MSRCIRCWTLQSGKCVIAHCKSSVYRRRTTSFVITVDSWSFFCRTVGRGTNEAHADYDSLDERTQATRCTGKDVEYLFELSTSSSNFLKLLTMNEDRIDRFSVSRGVCRWEEVVVVVLRNVWAAPGSQSTAQRCTKWPNESSKNGWSVGLPLIVQAPTARRPCVTGSRTVSCRQNIHKWLRSVTILLQMVTAFLPLGG